MPLLGIIPTSKAIASSSEARIPIVASGQKYPIVDAYMDLANKLLPELKSGRRGRSPNTPLIEKRDVKKFIAQVEHSELTPLVVDKGVSI
jgi:septum formation inhibitor-activating ATPase MinD